MSKYREIKTEFRTLESLIRALHDIDAKYEIAEDPTQPGLPLYGYKQDIRPERASIVLRRDWVNKHWSMGLSNDIGFAWNGSEYSAIISEYDSGNGGGGKGHEQSSPALWTARSAPPGARQRVQCCVEHIGKWANSYQDRKEIVWLFL